MLPFRLKPCSNEKRSRPSSSAGKAKVCYRKAEDVPGSWIWANMESRERYLINETRGVLFDRTKWWIMEGDPAPVGMETPDKRTVTGTALPPAVVLFEDEGSEDLLRCGFLVVEVRFGEGWRFDDVLLFNELFRYWRSPYDTHSQQFGLQLKSFQEPLTKMGVAAGANLYGERWMAALRVPLADGRRLLDVTDVDTDAVFGRYADDRAFVWARVLLSGEELRKTIPQSFVNGNLQVGKDPQTGFREMFGYWVKLLNVDKPCGYKPWHETNCATAFEKRWAADRTYRRWEHYDCYYGFNSFSAAMLSPPCEDPPTWQHWFEMYFDQMLLLLYVRVNLFKFSEGLTDVSAKMLAVGEGSKATAIEQWQNDFRKLRLAFTCFENLYQFPLLSNQQQAIEMYGLMRERMDIDDLYKEISTEITSSDELLEAEVEKQRNDYAAILNWVAAIGLGLSVALSCYQIQSFLEWWKGVLSWPPLMKWAPFLAESAPLWWCLLWVGFSLVSIGVMKGRKKRHQATEQEPR